jgi:hypothetical protein
VNTILLQNCEKFINQVIGFFSGGKIRAIEEMETELKKLTDKFILDTMNAYLESLDKAIVEDKIGRKRKGIVVERKNDKRELYTVFGHLRFNRTYFYDKRHQEYSYLLDKVVGLEKYDRVSGTVAVNLVEHASQYSYAKSTQNVTGGSISRQTVMKKVRALKELKMECPSPKRVVKVLHIDADEDHVALQDGSNTMVPLISIYEGVVRTGNRSQCLNIHHISSYGKKPEDLWLEAANWIYDVYEVEAIERIYLHGDGAQWIKEGLKWLPKAKLVLDKYHLNKAILQVIGNQPERRREIYSAIRNSDQTLFRRIANELLSKAASDSERKRIKDFKRYVLNNWQAITIYTEETCGGSGPEGHISHVLSSRLSSRPMGWSREGLRAMAELRAYTSSGGKITLKHLKQEQKKTYRLGKSIASKVSDDFFKTWEQLNNVPILGHGKVIPMFRCLRDIQNGSFYL